LYFLIQVNHVPEVITFLYSSRITDYFAVLYYQDNHDPEVITYLIIFAVLYYQDNLDPEVITYAPTREKRLFVTTLDYLFKITV
jgi:hypothetical protein